MLTLALAALLMPFELNIVGRLTGADIVLLLAFPILIARRRDALKAPVMKTFYALLGFWFFGAFVTDVIRQTPLEDVARGWAKIIVFGLDFGSVVMLVNGRLSRAVMSSFLAMVGLSIKLRLDIDGSGIGSDVFGDAWKFGYGTTFTAAVFLASSFLLRSLPLRPIGIVMPYAAAAIDLLLNARSIFGQAALAALVQTITALRRKPMPASQIAVLAVVCAIAGQGIISLYGYAANQGYLSREAQEKYEEQSKGSLGLLLGGRNESLASTEAIKDSPIIGHGSWARDRYYVDLMKSRLVEAGYVVRDSAEQSDLIPSHSHLLGAWVESGIAGGVFWVLDRLAYHTRAVKGRLRTEPVDGLHGFPCLLALVGRPFLSVRPRRAYIKFHVDSRLCFFPQRSLAKFLKESGMKFSVVTISFNQNEFLERAIQSVVCQTGVEIEYIVCDPGSTDGSRDIIERYRPQIACTVLERDSGPADGLNKGFQRATGDVFAI